MKIIFITGNQHKLKEVQNLLPQHQLHLPTDFGPPLYIQENGKDFFENAQLKARAFPLPETQAASNGGYPVLADDSGLCVNALGGAPGIYSARFGQEKEKKLTYNEQCLLLLEKMKGYTERRASFICCAYLYLGKERFFCIQEQLEGTITEVMQGNEGFGYDPVFYLPEWGKTLAELTIEEKNSISHRGKAMRGIANFLSIFSENSKIATDKRGKQA